MTRVEVLVVNWPVAKEPVEDCYNVRFPAEAISDHARWLAGEAARRQLHHVDLHDYLPPEDFVDSLHLNAEGNRKVADRLQTELDRILCNGRVLAQRN